MLRDFNTGISKDKKIRNRRKEDFHFINIDLELASFDDLQPLIDELGESVLVLYSDKVPNLNEYWASLEIKDYDIYQSYDDKTQDIGGVDVLLSAFCDLLENLSPQSQSLWKKCKKREFDVGFGCGNTEKSFHTQIRAETLKRVSELSANVLITVYPHLNYEIKTE